MSARQISVWLLLILMLVLVRITAWAQVYSGSLTGVIRDPSGAVVPGAKIKLLDVGKGYSFSGETNSEGRYLLRSLPPGRYKLFVALSGFKTHVQDGIQLDVNQNATIDITLQLGEQTDQVEVIGEPPLLAAQDAVTGQQINRTFINDLPLLGRSVLDLAYLAPGVTPPTACATCLANNFISNGGRNATADVLLDGVSSVAYETNGALEPLYTPSVDSVQEFKVQQSNFSAEVGFSGSTVVNVVTRSGNNQLHGSAYEFLRNNVLTANDWFANANDTKLAPRRYNLFGATVGGPVRKDRTFFFFDYEGVRDVFARTFQAGVPSAAMRQGDFSEICGAGFDASGECLDSEGQLWDPYSGVYDPNEGGPVRSRFIPFNNLATYQSPGNPKLEGTGFQLPARPGNLIDPVAQKLMQFYPLPNRGVGTAGYNRFNNWFSSGSDRSSNNRFDLKIDHSFSEKDRVSARFSRLGFSSRQANCFGNAADSCAIGPYTDEPNLFALNYVHTFNPNTLLNVSYGTSRKFFTQAGLSEEFPDVDSIETLGMPSYMLTTSGSRALPAIELSNYAYAGKHSIGSSAWNGGTRRGQETHHLLGSLSRVQGRHDLKFGGEGRMHRTNEVLPGVPAGLFAFDFNSTSQYPWSGGGDSMASFLTGVGTGGGGWGLYQVPAWVSTQNFQFGGFVQDNWRVTDKLTLNLGLRYDLETPRTERFNRMSYLDPEAASPLQVPGFSNLRGGLAFVNSNLRSNYITDRNNLGPRFGLAYRLRDKLVLRGGYGIYYQGSLSGALGIGGGDTQGFAQDTDWITSFQGDGATPWGRLSDPFPITGPARPSAGSKGLLTDVGLSVYGPLRTRDYNTTPYEQAWSLGLQRELPGSVLVDTTYVGKKGTRLHFGGAGSLNSLGPELASYSRDQIAMLFNFVPNPFSGIITSGGLSGPEIQAWQLQRPFPHFQGFEAAQLPVANSIYHAFQLRVEKRFSRGLQFLLTYTNAKSIDDSSINTGGASWLGQGVSLQDPNRRYLERSLSQFDISQVLQFSYVYELPVGRGKAFGTNWNPWLNGIIGGWKTNGIWRFSSGQPIALGLQGGQSLPTYGPQRPDLTGTLRRNDGSNFREQYFVNPETAVRPQPYAIGTSPRVLPNLRSPGITVANLSLFKEVPLDKFREGMRIEYRVEAFNAFNHPMFCGPVATVGSPNFGRIFSQCQASREIQMAMKFYW
ncbi:MAG: TonB-dependent receptor [Acidobacteriota bacterium]